MKIGIPKEIKNNENRVGMTPAGVFELTKKAHTVFVQSTAGVVVFDSNIHHSIQFTFQNSHTVIIVKS